MSTTQAALPASYPVLAIPTSVDYTSLDFSGFVQSLLAYAPQAMPNWNPNASEGDFGVVMLELMAYVGDILSYYGSRISQEAYLPTATQRVSLLNIANLLGYTPYGPIPAEGTVTFATFPGGPAVTIPALTQVTTNVTPDGLTEPPVYETQAAITVAASGGTATVEVIQGITYAMQQIGTSTGQPGQTLSLPSLDIETDSTLTVYVEGATGQYVQWTAVDNLINATGAAEVYSVSTDDSGVTWITFGDNTNGVIPGVGLTAWCTYRVIVGSLGNLPAGTIGTIYSQVSGAQIALQGDGTTPQSSAMTGGSDAESNDSIRTNAALAFTAQNRAVSLQDFTNLAYAVPGVLMANATGVNATSVSLYIAGPNYAAPDPMLVDDVLDYFSTLTAAGVSLSVLDPAIILIDVGTTANPMQLVVQSGYSQSTVTSQVQSAIQALLSPPNVSFGQLINVSDIYEAVLAVNGVAYCVIPVFTREDTPQANDTAIQLRASEFANPGNVYMTASGGF